METKQHVAERPVVDQRKWEAIKKFLESKKKENTTHQNLWDTEKAIVRGKFIPISAYINKTETSQINNLIMHLKLLEKQEQPKSKSTRQREKVKIRAEINEIKTKKNKKKTKKQNYKKNQINGKKSCFFEKINKISKPLANMTKWKREKTQVNKIRDEKGDITTNINKILRII
jgi:hypothetical protein